MQITTIGLDLAKHWFQVHGVDANGHVVVRRRLWRSGVMPRAAMVIPSRSILCRIIAIADASPGLVLATFDLAAIRRALCEERFRWQM
jgi:hypothetical protein